MGRLLQRISATKYRVYSTVSGGFWHVGTAAEYVEQCMRDASNEAKINAERAVAEANDLDEAVRDAEHFGVKLPKYMRDQLTQRALTPE